MKVAAAAIMILAVALAVVPMFTDCHSAGRALTLEGGRQIPMKCHWTGRAELGLALPLFVVGLMLAFAKYKETRRTLGITGITLGLVAILLPTVLIGVCMKPDMPCVSAMQPALILAGVLTIGIGLAVMVRSWGPEEEQV
jgi:uncharacterized membrane protein